jgi:hypothetical protein
MKRGEKHMHQFYIVGHVKRSAEEFLAQVGAVPVGSRSGRPVEEIGESASTLLQAKEAMKRLAIVMGAKIRARGGMVYDVDM